MRIAIESTDKVTTLDGVPVRYWRGTTEDGVDCHVFVHRIAVHQDFVANGVEVPPVEQVAPARSVPLASLLECEPGIAAIKRVALVACRLPWELGRAETAAIAGMSADQIADLATAELAGGPIQSSEARGVAAFLTKILEDDRLNALDRDVWANVLGQSRQRSLAAESHLHRANKLADGQAHAIAELRGLLERCEPLIETSDAPAAQRLFHDIRKVIRPDAGL